MKIKLDENLPTRIARVFERLGHDVDTVVDEGLAGADDPTVSATAARAGRLVITLDRGFGDIRQYPPGGHAGILVVRIEDHAAAAVAASIADLLARSISMISPAVSPSGETGTCGSVAHPEVQRTLALDRAAQER